MFFSENTVIIIIFLAWLEGDREEEMRDSCQIDHYGQKTS